MSPMTTSSDEDKCKSNILNTTHAKTINSQRKDILRSNEKIEELTSERNQTTEVNNCQEKKTKELEKELEQVLVTRSSAWE